MRIAYLVSRFPHVSETFIFREMTAVAAHSDVSIRVHSLFPARSGVVHPAARPWVDGHRRASLGDGLRGLAYWALRRPARLLASIAVVLWEYRSKPRLAARALFTVFAALGLALELRRSGVRHVHAHYATYPALAAWVCRRLTGIPYSFTAHAHDIFMDTTFLTHCLGAAEFVVAISEYNRQHLGPFNHSGRPIHVIHCGVGAVRPSPRSSPRNVDVRRILTVGSLEEYKGHAVLVRAFARLKVTEAPSPRLDIVGDGPLREELQALAASLGVADRVSFLGSQTESQVATLLEQADIFVLASVVARTGQMDGIPVALMEAMAAGVPVVASRLSGIPELVRDGDTGILTKPGDVDGLSRALQTMLERPEASTGAVSAGRRLVEESFSLERSGSQLVSLFRATTG